MLRRYIGSIAFVSLIGVGAFALLISSLLPEAPSHSISAARMQVIKRRVLRYYNEHEEIPVQISNLPEIDGMDNNIVNEWGKPFVLICNFSKITVISLGRDGLFGGKGDDADMIGEFDLKRNRNKVEEFCEWSVDPLSQIMRE